MKNFFYFSYLHRLAILILTVVIISISICIESYKNDQLNTDYNFTEFQNEVNKLQQIKQQAKSTNFPPPTPHKKTYSKPKQQLIEINMADTADFEKLPQIGPFFAKRIHKYRNLLGGFYSKNQLREVYGMDSARFTQFENFILIDTSLIIKKNINSIKEEELRKHPYISYKLASVICNYRHQHGHFKSIGDLKNIHLIDSNKFCKIVPYFTTNESQKSRNDN